MTRPCLGFVLALAGFACAKPDPRRDAWTKACHAHEQVPAGSSNTAVVGWIQKNVTEPSVVDAFTQAATTEGDKRAILRNAAKTAGVTECAVVDALWKN